MFGWKKSLSTQTGVPPKPAADGAPRSPEVGGVEMASRQGPPKHPNRFAWKPNAGQKKNETEVGGKFRPYSEITGVCPRCREQIDWKRRYGKYKPLIEPAKCQKCTKRAVRQAYHNLCSNCAREHGVCAKCCCKTEQIIGRESSEVEAEQKALEEAIKNSRERDRRTLLRAVRFSDLYFTLHYVA
ncbi:hypothetical protein Taro_034974 [Colocasia esculenta]|uniref:Uncharacterized protein n=1 Tax=Colocasia esculenta TaxID=4460 RepID=A0A843VZ69_COLES|nr:hypothetical protein [Colocasia esculenta]